MATFICIRLRWLKITIIISQKFRASKDSSKNSDNSDDACVKYVMSDLQFSLFYDRIR